MTERGVVFENWFWNKIFTYPISTQKFDVSKTHHSPYFFGTFGVSYSGVSSLNCQGRHLISLEK